MARRILVVEDEAPIREMVCFVLEQNGFQPVEAEDYDSAVNQLNEPWPDLILLDWMLPGGSGLQFIKLLKREAMTRDIPVVMLTARGEEEDRVRGLETGADDYLPSLLTERAGGADQSGDAPYFADGGGRGDRNAGSEPRPFVASGDDRRQSAGHGADGI